MDMITGWCFIVLLVGYIGAIWIACTWLSTISKHNQHLARRLQKIQFDVHITRMDLEIMDAFMTKEMERKARAKK